MKLSFVANQHFVHKRQCLKCRVANILQTAGIVQAEQPCLYNITYLYRNPHSADRLTGRAASRACNTRCSYGTISCQEPRHPTNHMPDDLLADSALRLEHSGRDAKNSLFDIVVIGHHRTTHNSRTSRNRGYGLRHCTACTTLGRGNCQRALGKRPDKLRGQSTDCIGIIHHYIYYIVVREKAGKSIAQKSPSRYL